MTNDMPGLPPIGHLVNARRAVQRYVETGGQLDVGDVQDELDELRRLVLDVGDALESLAADARVTGKPGRRAAGRVDVARARLLAAARNELQPAVHGLMAAPSRRGAA